MTMSELIGWDDLISETEQNNYDRLINNQENKLLEHQQIFKQAFRVYQHGMLEQYKPFKTGIFGIDNALNGGFVKQTLTVVTGSTGIGKTTWLTQLCENIALNNEDATILYFNLEMSTDSLVARSLSRITGLNSVDILRSYNMTPEDQQKLQQGIDLYINSLENRIIYNPTVFVKKGEPISIDSLNTEYKAFNEYLNGNTETREQYETFKYTRNDIDSILKISEMYANVLPEAPIICIDYLQLLTSAKGLKEHKNHTDIIQDALVSLLDYAERHDTMVFLISANNRSSDKIGEASIDSGRDTSSIEYSGGVVISLNYWQAEISKDNKDGFEPMNPKEINRDRMLNPEKWKNIPININILKNRFGAPKRVTAIFKTTQSEYEYDSYTSLKAEYMTPFKLPENQEGDAAKQKAAEIKKKAAEQQRNKKK